jgi:hypothetical protein
MARPSKLSPAQWREVERRAAAGESIAALAKEFGVGRSTVSERVSVISDAVRETAHKVAAAQTALAALPVAQQYNAISLADKLRNISASLAAAAECGAATAHRLAALANGEVQKINDAEIMKPESLEAMRGVAALTKLSNEAASTGLNLLSANKETVTRINNPQDAEVLAPVRERLPLADWKKAHGLA